MDLNALLEMPELGMTLLSGRGHLNRRIRWVIPTDLRDPSRYLSGGELVLTGMLWRHDNTNADNYVRGLQNAGVAALGAGDPELDTIPDELVDACRRHELPLFAVNSQVSFSTITEAVVQRLSANRSADLAAVLERHRHLIASDSGVTDMLELVQAELGMNCQVLSSTGRLIHSTGDRGDMPDPAARTAIATRALRDGRLPARLSTEGNRYSVFGIGSVPHTRWLLVVDDDHTQWPPQRRDVADELVALLRVEQHRSLETPQCDRDLIAALSRDAAPEELAAQLRQAGLSVEARHIVAVATGAQSARVTETLCAEAFAATRAVFATRDNETIAVIETGEDAETLLERVRDCVAVMRAATPPRRVAMGLSTPAHTAELDGALRQARHTASLAAAEQQAVAVAGPESITSHVLLLSHIPSEVRHGFVERVLGPVLEYDKDHQSDLVATLRQFLESQGSWSRCAVDMHVHVNTLRYRIERIEQLTGRDLRKITDRVDMFLALRLAP